MVTFEMPKILTQQQKNSQNISIFEKQRRYSKGTSFKSFQKFFNILKICLKILNGIF